MHSKINSHFAWTTKLNLIAWKTPKTGTCRSKHNKVRLESKNQTSFKHSSFASARREHRAMQSVLRFSNTKWQNQHFDQKKDSATIYS